MGAVCFAEHSRFLFLLVISDRASSSSAEHGRFQAVSRMASSYVLSSLLSPRAMQITSFSCAVHNVQDEGTLISKVRVRASILVTEAW